MTFDRTHAAALVDGPPDDMLWSNDEDPDTGYVNGWDDSVRANAIPLAEQLAAAIVHIDQLEAKASALFTTADRMTVTAVQLRADRDANAERCVDLQRQVTELEQTITSMRTECKAAKTYAESMSACLDETFKELEGLTKQFDIVVARLESATVERIAKWLVSHDYNLLADRLHAGDWKLDV